MSGISVRKRKFLTLTSSKPLLLFFQYTVTELCYLINAALPFTLDRMHQRVYSEYLVPIFSSVVPLPWVNSADACQPGFVGNCSFLWLLIAILGQICKHCLGANHELWREKNPSLGWFRLPKLVVSPHLLHFLPTTRAISNKSIVRVSSLQDMRWNYLFSANSHLRRRRATI